MIQNKDLDQTKRTIQEMVNKRLNTYKKLPTIHNITQKSKFL